jgi:hypothetical protein
MMVFPVEGLDKNLLTTAETQDEMEGKLLLDVVIRQSASFLKLIAGKDSKDETLLIKWDVKGKDKLIALESLP